MERSRVASAPHEQLPLRSMAVAGAEAGSSQDLVLVAKFTVARSVQYCTLKSSI